MKRAFLIVILCLLAFPAIEGLTSVGLLVSDIRALQPPPANFRQATYDSLVGWVGLPNLANRDNFGPNLTLTTNADGLRIHRPTTPIPAPGEKRIMCSGASFTFGSGVADGETFCARLDLLLPGVRTINVAQRGFGLDQTYLWYKRERARYPHVLQIFAVNGTDFERTAQANLNGYPKPTLVIKDGALVAQNVPVPEWKGWSRWTDAGPAFAGLRLPQLIAGRREKSEATEQKRIDDQLWPAVEGIFRELVQMNKESGSAIVLVYLPIADEYLPGVRDVRRARLQKSMQKLGVPFVDLTNDLRKIERDSLPWMFITPNTIPVAGITGHYTASGHQWIANTLVEHFKNLSTVQAVLAGTVR